jgi:hypothetical protein
MQILGAETTSMIRFQLLCQRSHDLFAVARPFTLKYLGMYTLTDPPVKHR